MRSEFEAETGSDLYIPVNDVLDRISYLLECHGITYSRYETARKAQCASCPNLSSKTILIRSVAIRTSAKVKLDRFKNELLDQE